MAVARPQIQQRLPFVDREGRLSNEGLRAINDALGSLFNQIQQIAELYGITDTLNSGLTALAGSGVVLAASGGFGSGRVLSGSPTIGISDGGPGGTITASFAGSTMDVPEGVTNLYFTEARARSSLSSGTGISYSGGTGMIAVATNGVSNSLIRQSAAFSVIGRAGNTTGDVADLTAASDGQVLRRSGSTLGFGAVDLSSAGGVTGILTASKGGTGAASFTANALIKGNGTGALSSSVIQDNGTEVGIGTAPVASFRHLIKGTGTGSGTYAQVVRNGANTNLHFITDDGAFYTGDAAASPYNNTTAAAANAVLGIISGQLLRSTSSRRYKTGIRDYTNGLDAVNSLRPVFYQGKNDGEKLFAGFIAEEVEGAGLHEFVQYDEQGRPDALYYANMVALLAKAVQELSVKVDGISAP